jgi:hypothetical protein
MHYYIGVAVAPHWLLYYTDKLFQTPTIQSLRNVGVSPLLEERKLVGIHQK